MSYKIGKVVDRTTLWPGLQRDLERRQLNPLDAEDQIKFSEHLKIQNSLKRDGIEATKAKKRSVQLGDRGLNYQDLDGIVGPTILYISNRAVDQYMDSICAYVNLVRQPVVPGQKDGIRDGKSLFERLKLRFPSKSPRLIDSSLKLKSPSCRWMSSEQFSECTTVSRASQVLGSLKLDGERFKSLDYLLIAYRNEVHHALIGLAPKQKFAFIIDSVGTRSGNLIERADVIPRAILMRVLFSQVAETETWPLFTQWSQRDNSRNDGSPNVTKQTDFHNCGVFTVMNALCLAFGYDLLCYAPQDLEPLKRPRMLMELLQGNLGGKYDYDMLDIPNGPLYMNPIRFPQFATNPGGGIAENKVIDMSQDMTKIENFIDLTSEAENLGPETTPPQFAKSPGEGVAKTEVIDASQDMTGMNRFIDLTPAVANHGLGIAPKIASDNFKKVLDPDDKEPKDLDESFGILDPMEWMSGTEESAAEDLFISPYPSPPLTGTSKLDDVFSSRLQRLIPSAEKAIKNDLIHRLPEMHKMWDADREYVHESETEQRAFPPQFNAKYFRKEGFLYGSSTHVVAVEALSSIGIEERKVAYASSDIEGIDEWMNENPDIIDRWARNKMAAFAAKFWDETVDPNESLMEGYENWYSKRMAKERDEHASFMRNWATELDPDFKARRDALYQFKFIREKMKKSGTQWKDLR